MSEQSLLEEFVTAVHAAGFGIEFSLSDDGRHVVFADQTATFGDIVVEEDGEEIIVTYGRFTHSHFACYEEHVGLAQRRAHVVESVIETLKQVFNGDIVFHGSHVGGGGCGRREFLDQHINSRSNTEIISWPNKIVS